MTNATLYMTNYRSSPPVKFFVYSMLASLQIVYYAMTSEKVVSFFIIC